MAALEGLKNAPFSISVSLSLVQQTRCQFLGSNKIGPPPRLFLQTHDRMALLTSPTSLLCYENVTPES